MLLDWPQSSQSDKSSWKCWKCHFPLIFCLMDRRSFIKWSDLCFSFSPDHSLCIDKGMFSKIGDCTQTQPIRKSSSVCLSGPFLYLKWIARKWHHHFNVYFYFAEYSPWDWRLSWYWNLKYEKSWVSLVVIKSVISQKLYWPQNM